MGILQNPNRDDHFQLVTGCSLIGSDLMTFVINAAPSFLNSFANGICQPKMKIHV